MIFPVRVARDDLELVAFAHTHVEELWASIVNDRTDPRHRGVWPAIHTREALKAYLVGALSAGEAGYVLRVDGVLAGTLHLFDFALDRRVEMGFGLHHAYQGRGLATRAVLLMEDPLRLLGFERVRITCPRWNVRSSAVAERAGYHFVRAHHRERDCAGCDDCVKEFEKVIG